MEIEKVREFLQKNGEFDRLAIEDYDQNLIFNLNNITQEYKEKESLQRSFWDNGLEVWISNYRIVVTKQYESYTYFKDSWKDNQIIISNLLNFLPLKYKNNLYFLIVLDFDKHAEFNNQLVMEVNKAEKNAKYCRKYIIQDKDDLERMPFFHDATKSLDDSFSIENRFLELLIQDSNNINSHILQTINDYFKPEMRNLIKDKDSLKLVIEKSLGGEFSNEITPNDY